MKLKFARWYMEVAWVRMSKLRNVRWLHHLFNWAYATRRVEYLAALFNTPPSPWLLSRQRERGESIRYMLDLAKRVPLPSPKRKLPILSEYCGTCGTNRPSRFAVNPVHVFFKCLVCNTEKFYRPLQVA